MTTLSLSDLRRDCMAGPPPHVSPLDILDLARLYRSDPELALELAAASAAQTKKEPTK